MCNCQIKRPKDQGINRTITFIIYCYKYICNPDDFNLSEKLGL